MNYGFYISSTSTRLIKFLEQAEPDTIKKIKVVFSEYPVGDALLHLLDEHEIAYAFCDYSAIPGTNNREKNLVLSNMLLRALKEHGADYCFTYGTHILCGDLLKEYEYRLINFHPAILPMFPGLKAIDQAVEHGRAFLLGNTVHFIDEGTDTGIIIMQSVIPVQAFLQERNYDIVLDLQIEMLNRMIKVLEEDRLYIENGRALIRCADYNSANIYPMI